MSSARDPRVLPGLWAALIEGLEAYLERPSAKTALRAELLVPRLRSVTWQARAWTATARYPGDDAAGHASAQVRLIFDPRAQGQVCTAVCSCDAGAAGAGAEALCGHAWALARLLLDLTEPTAPVGFESLAHDLRLSLGSDSWRYGLESLTRLVAREEGPEDTPRARLVYRVQARRHRAHLRLSLQGYIQRKSEASGSDGQWTKGRRISWLHWPIDEPVMEDGMGPLIEDLVRGQSTPGLLPAKLAFEREAGLATASLLSHLVGSTRVAWVDEPRRCLAVERGELKLRIEACSAESIRVVISLGRARPEDARSCTAIDGHHLAVVPQDEASLVVSAHLPQTLVEAVCTLLVGAREFPRSRLPALLDALGRVSEGARRDVLDIQPELSGRQSAGDARPLVELEALADGGLQIHIRAAPHPEVGSFAPGEGPEILHIVSGGVVTQIERDLELELKRAHSLAAALQLEVGREGGASRANWGFTLVQVGDALDRLAILQAQSSELRVHWFGAARVVHAPVETGQLVLRINRRPGWFDLRGGAELPAGELPLSAMLAAVADGRRYVEINPGDWTTLSSAVRRQLQVFEACTGARGAGRAMPELALPAFADLLDPQVQVQADEDWQRQWAAWSAAKEVDPTLPTLNAELRNYQRDGLAWLRRMAQLGLGACLADDMGLGKTLQALAVLSDRTALGPALVVAPMSVVDNWLSECRRFAPELIAKIYRGPERAGVLEGVRAGDLLLTSHNLFQRDAAELAAQRWSTLVLDEAQVIKNPGTKIARAARDCPADWKLALTGTPIENRLSDLWSLFRVIAPGLLGSLRHFNDSFVIPIERYDDQRRARALATRVQPFILRRCKSDVLSELPPVTRTVLNVELDSDERDMYERTRRTIVESLAGQSSTGDRRLSVLAGLTKLRQLACHPALVDHRWKRSSAKLEALVGLIVELRASGHESLVFSQFTRFLDLVEPALQAADLTWARLDGTMDAARRAQEVERFQSGACPVMLISLKAGGTGLNLTRASYVIACDPWWNPAVEDQALGRAHRIGQTRTVHWVKLVTRDTVEERVAAIHSDKRELVDSMLQGTGRAAQLDIEELVELLGEQSSPRTTEALSMSW